MVCTMEIPMNTLCKTLLIAAGAATVTVGIVTISPQTASAAVVCNSSGDCWRVRGRPDYNPDLNLRIYGDNWRWHRGENYRWRNSGRGHGYYRDGVWITIPIR
jgi:hypothetical protein